MGRMRDRHGNTVEPAVLGGRAVLIVRDRYGYALSGARVGIADPTTPEQAAALGVDLTTLQAA